MARLAALIAVSLIGWGGACYLSVLYTDALDESGEYPTTVAGKLMFSVGVGYRSLRPRR
jgi:hypothetical protein